MKNEKSLHKSPAAYYVLILSLPNKACENITTCPKKKDNQKQLIQNFPITSTSFVPSNYLQNL